MTDASSPVLSSDEIEWKTFTKKDGSSYEVGFPKDTGSDAEDALVNEKAVAAGSGVQGKEDFGIAVNWPVGDTNWKATSEDVQRIAAITSYTLHTNSGTYAYMLEFANAEHYNYHFFDATGDSYKVNTFRNGNHYVRYNSTKPTILYITGS